jgi:hypothetical protein
VTLEVLHCGVERGEIRADIDFEAVTDELFAPVYHRLFFGHSPLDDDLAATIVGQLLTGISAGQ